MNNVFLHIEDNKAIGTNGVFAQGYEIDLTEKYSLGEEDYLNLDAVWNRALKDMPAGSILLKQDVFMQKDLNTDSFPSGNFLQKATKNYFDKRTYLSHKCYLFFVLPAGDTFTTKITNPFKRLNRKKFEKFDDNINSFINTVEQVVSFLKNAKLNSGNAFNISEMSSDEMYNYYDYYFNNFQDEFVTDRVLKNGYIQIGDRYLGAICTRDEESMPEKFKPLQADDDFPSAKYKFFQNIGDIFSFKLKFDHV